MTTSNAIYTPFITSIILKIEHSKLEFKDVLSKKVENLIILLKEVETKDFETVYKDFLNNFIEFYRTILINQIDIFDLINFENIPRTKAVFIKKRKLHKLYNEIFRIFINLVNDLKTKDFSELQQIKDIEELSEYKENSIKFLFYFILADMLLENRIKLNKSKKKILFVELKKNFEIFFAILKIYGLYKINEDTNIQTERNIIITSRILKTKHNLLKTSQFTSLDDILKMQNV